jgi:abhydrolase domain-containing protein 11
VKPDDLKHANELLSKDVPEKAIRAFLLTNFQPDEILGHLVPIINLDGIANNLVNIFDFPEARHPTSHYHKPCLFLGGTRSDYIDPGKREVYAQLFPTVEIQMIAGAGHWIHSEKPHEFQAALLDFIGKHEHGTISQTDKERYKQRSHQPHDVRKH